MSKTTDGLHREMFFANLAYRKEFLFGDADRVLLDKFKKYHETNPEVFRTFRRLTKEMAITGRKRYSAWCIINKIRWDHDIKTIGDEFKISNDYIALMARLLIYHEPQFIDFFEIKPMKHGRAEAV